MAWMEGKLQPIDLLSALQMKRQRDEGGNSNRNAMEREQLKAMQEQNKMAELKRGLLTPGPKTRTMDSPYTIGFPEYQQEQEKIKYAAMATGQPLPNQGFIGGGGGDSSEPTPGDSAEQVAKTDLLKQQGNLAEEQARMVQQQRSGYGSATRDLLNQQQLEAEKGKIASGIREAEIKSNGVGYDQMGRGLQEQAKATASGIAAGDKQIDKTKMAVEDLAIISNPVFKKINSRKPDDGKVIKEAFKQFYAQAVAGGVPPTQEIITKWINTYYPQK
jgi:hypothetical protein